MEVRFESSLSDEENDAHFYCITMYIFKLVIKTLNVGLLFFILHVPSRLNSLT